MPIVVQVDAVGDDGYEPPTTSDARNGDQAEKSQQPSPFALFVMRTWVQLLFAFAIMSTGIAVALYLYFALGRFEGDSKRAAFVLRAEALSTNMQYEINSLEADLSSLGTQLQLQPSTTRLEFKIAYDRLIVKDSGRCLDCWEAMFYAPFAPDSERALLESIAQSDLNDTGLQFQNPMPALPNALPNGTQPSPIELEYIPIYYIEPLDFINRGTVLINLASLPIHNSTITKARVTSKTQASPPIPITIKIEGEDRTHMPSYIAGLGTLIAHPFNFLPGLQSGKEGVQGVIGGGLRMSTFLEHFMKASRDHLTISLVDVSESSHLFTSPQFLHEIETADASSGVLRSSKGLSIADVERNAMKADLKADLILNCFSRKWRLLIVGDPKDYTHTSLQVNLVVCVAVGIATVLICALVLFTIARNHQKLRLSDKVISKLEELDAENITDRKKAEDKLSEMNRVAQDLRLLIDTANVPCFGIDKEGMVNEWNKKSAELVGYTADEVIGRDLFQDFINPEFRNAVRKVLDDALKGLITSSFEFYFFSKTGVPIELLLNANPRRSATGDIVGVLVISQDMTEKRKSMETEIDLSKAKAANDAKSQFLANMSHEMRTPLNGVIAVNQLLLQTPLNAEQRELAELNQTSADSLLSLINDILDLTRVESGKLELEYFDFDIRNTVEDAIDSIIMAASSKGIEVVCTINTTSPDMFRARGDGDRLKQVVLNLLSNAIKFTQSGEVEVRAELKSETATHLVLKVCVRDTGIGIPQEAQSKLFSRFTQVDSSTTRNYGGSGLGLAISKQLVKLMSGTIGVTSTPGSGSTFWFSITLERVKLPCSEARQQLPSDMRPMLVVSWNSSTRNMLTGYLEAWGAEVSAAADKVEAQIYLKAHPTTVTTIISFSPPEHDLAALMPIVNFIATSITEVRFWIILCPISFIGKIRDLVAEMAKSFAAKGELLAAHAARSVTIMSKPVRQGVLYNCLMQLHANGVYRYEGVEYEEAKGTCSMPNDDEKRHSLDMSAGANSIVSNLESPWCSLSSFTRRSSPSYTLQSSTKVPLFKVLVAEDSKANQMALKSMLSKHGVVVTVVADGSEVVDLVVRRGVRFNLALFDINMPIMGGVEALRLIRQFSIDMPVIAITASVDDAQLQYLMDEGFSMVTTKPLRVSTCRELLAKYGHIFLPLNPGSKHQPATKSPRGSQETTQTSSWVEDMSKGASAVAARHDPVAPTSLAIVDPSARTPATAELAVHSVPRDFRAKRGRGQPSVLIVMHNTTERLLLKAVCQLEGCVVHTSETGVNALKTLAANEGTYTLCLVDTVLPDVEPHSFCSQMLELVRGQAAAVKLANAHPVALVLMGTAAFAPSRATVVDIGCEDLLQKPVTRSTLRLLLARIKINYTTSAPALQITTPKLAGKHLLYAEDSMPNQIVMKRMLEKAGAKCTLVDNGKAAVEAVLNDPSTYDIILMDCNMPVQDGWEATKEIQRAQGHSVPIIAVTANALKGDREKCLDAGMDDYITKPVNLSRLIDIVVKWIALSDARRDAEESVRATAAYTGEEREPSGDVSNLRWNSFSIYDSIDTSRSLHVRERLLTVAPPSKQSVDVLMSLDQVNGDWESVIDTLQRFCIRSKEKLMLCSRAAHVCDTATLSSVAHAMQAGALACYAVQLASSCGILERIACRQQDSIPAETNASSSTALSLELSEYLKRLVGDVAECLDTLTHDVNALASMRTLPSWGTFNKACADYKSAEIVDALSNLLVAAVSAYVAAHDAVFQNEERAISDEVPSGVARAKLSFVCAAANALSVADLVLTAEKLSEHLAKRPLSPPRETLSTVHVTNVYRLESQRKLYDVRITVECLAAELSLILGEAMPVLEDIPFAHGDLEPAVRAYARNSLQMFSSNNTLAGWVGEPEPFCDYSMLMHNTGDDHNLVTALLSSFKDSFFIFCDSLAPDQTQECLLFDAQSLHGAAVSLCAPRAVATITNFIIASKHKRSNETSDIVDPSVTLPFLTEDALERSINELRAAGHELAAFLQALENRGQPSRRASCEER